MIMIHNLTSNGGEPQNHSEAQVTDLDELVLQLVGGLFGAWPIPFPVCMHGEDLPCRF